MSAPARVKPNRYAEDSLTDLWRKRQLAKEHEDKAKAKRYEVEEELFRRFQEEDAHRLGFGNGLFIDLDDSPTYNWHGAATVKLGEYLISRAFLTKEQWQEVVWWTPRIRGGMHTVKAWLKLGGKVPELVEAARMPQAPNRPTLKGPSLKDMEG